ncbi:transglycosylase domain-containing protein [Streptomyces sp. NPDC060194]|uniref:transglycosylase domain-containing protein n=1 Tax=Streptomyces sp. NPDC060194 TaxID=3347069 RepID=UPI003650E75B
MSDESQQGTEGPQGWAPRGRPEGDAGAAGPEGGGKKKRSPLRRALRWALGILLALFLAGAAVLVTAYFLVDIPEPNQQAVAQSNVYLYSDGTQLARDGGKENVNRQNITLDQVPLDVQRAVLAAEDRDFYDESAVDPQALVRATWNTLTGKGKQGGSTITQQYVKNYYLDQDQTLLRKLKELIISVKLGQEKSKNEILEGYLNTSYFGRNAYGIQAASQAYYSRDIEAVDVSRGAYLASLLNAPSAYDVVVHPENKGRAEARWNYVLDGMVKEDWLGQSERDALDFPTPGPVKAAAGMSGQRGYVVKAVEDYLLGNDVLSEDELAAGGHRITTTIDRKKQRALTDAAEETVVDKLGTKAPDAYVRVGAASIDPASGKVVALYGGRDYTEQYTNTATRRDYQVGSIFKPYLFTSAVDNRSKTQGGQRITPNTIYNGDNKRPVQGPDGPIGYAPENEDQRSYGDIPVTTAMDRSVNSVFAQMAEDVGSQRVKDTAIDLGLPEDTPELNAYPSIALGVATASVLDMAEGYATLADHGRHGTYRIVQEITKDGRNVGLPKTKTRQAVSRESADTTTSILRSVVRGGTGTAAAVPGWQVAGKTGTAEEDKAAWFAGYTPKLVTVVNVIGMDPVSGAQKPLYGALGQPRINGGGPPAQIFSAYTTAALAGTDPVPFDLDLEPGALDEPSSSAPESSAAPSSSEPESESPSPSASATDSSPAPESPESPPTSPSTPEAPESPDAPDSPGDGEDTPSGPSVESPPDLTDELFRQQEPQAADDPGGEEQG